MISEQLTEKECDRIRKVVRIQKWLPFVTSFGAGVFAFCSAYKLRAIWKACDGAAVPVMHWFKVAVGDVGFDQTYSGSELVLAFWAQDVILYALTGVVFAVVMSLEMRHNRLLLKCWGSLTESEGDAELCASPRNPATP